MLSPTSFSTGRVGYRTAICHEETHSNTSYYFRIHHPGVIHGKIRNLSKYQERIAKEDHSIASVEIQRVGRYFRQDGI